MKKIYFLLLSTFLFIPFGFSQQNNFNWRVGLQTGNMTYRGDLNEKFWQKKEMFATDYKNFSFGLSIENTPNKTLSNRLQLTYGEFTANDRSTGILERSLNVQTKIYSAAYIFTFYTDNGWLLGENAFLSPYLMAGVGGTYFENYGDLFYTNSQDTKSPYYYWSDNTIRDAAESGGGNTGNGQIITQDGKFETRLSDFKTEKPKGYSPYALTVPVGVGLKLRLLNRLSFHIQSMINYSLTSDYLDDVSGNFRNSYDNAEQNYVANPANYNNGQGSRGNINQGFLKNDAFIFTSFGISWSFSPKKQAFNAPVLYAANRPKSIFELNPDSLKTVTVDGIPDYQKNSEISTNQNNQSQNNQNSQNQNNQGQNQNPYNYNQNSQYPYNQNQQQNPIQNVKIDINVNVTTTKSGSDSTITKVVVIPQNGEVVNSTQNSTSQLQQIEQEKKDAEAKKELEELENRLREIENDKKTKKTKAQRKADEEAQEKSRLEMEQLQNQLEELKNNRKNDISITLENPNNQATTQKQDSATYKLMELQFDYMQKRMASLEKQLENQVETQTTNSTKDEDLAKITQQLNTLQTQLEIFANQNQKNANDTVVVMNKNEKTPTTSEVIGVKKVEIFFKTASSVIVPKDKEKIAPLIEVLKNDQNLSVRIYGFTDSKGSAAFNQKLSKQRTEAVKKLLLDAGISENRIVEGSFGIDTNNPYGEDFYGRRVEIELVGK